MTTSMINYLIEANTSLVFFLAIYYLFLRKEDAFRVQRFYLLLGIIVSIFFPLIHIDTNAGQRVFAVGTIIPQYWLPTIDVGDNTTQFSSQGTSLEFWSIARLVYLSGVMVGITWLLLQIYSAWKGLREPVAYRLENIKVIESTEDKPSFAFFNFIFIGRSNTLSATEKEQIIRHESEHVTQLHSFDILLISLVRIAFWFNPLTYYYKKLFIQLHEFEADARAVENSDVNKYCSLLARVALHEYVPIASHFNESLTLKRIDMIRKNKTKIKRWKYGVVLFTIIGCSAFVACQDQVADEVANSTISQQGEYPDDVKKEMDLYKASHPDAKLTYIEGDVAEIDNMLSTFDMTSKIVKTFTRKQDDIDRKGILFVNVVQQAESLTIKDKVFVVVEQMPEYPGGENALKDFIRKNLRYPEEARKDNKEGTVVLAMVIDDNGSVSDVSVMRSVHPHMDEEAVRMVRMLPKWSPGRQNGKNVNTRVVLPIRFSLDRVSAGEIEHVQVSSMKAVALSRERSNGTTIISGQIIADGKNLDGANVVIGGTTTGIATGRDGKFALSTPLEHGELFVSFVGYETVTAQF